MIKIILVIFSTFYSLKSLADDKILSSPLINLEKLKPSFEETDEAMDDTVSNEVLKNKKLLPNNNSTSALLIGLDKITAKTSEIRISMGETKKFGPLEIKVLKCGKYADQVKFNSAKIRGLDIYTGFIVETNLKFEVKNPKGKVIDPGSCCSGGEYLWAKIIQLI